jgi:hypothetical protein
MTENGNERSNGLNCSDFGEAVGMIVNGGEAGSGGQSILLNERPSRASPERRLI